MNTPSEPTEAEIQGAAILSTVDSHRPLPLVRDWRLWGAIFATASVLALFLALWIVNNELNHVRNDASILRAESTCRAEVSARLRDADSEVILQNALIKQIESGISAALGATVVDLTRREAVDQRNIDSLDRASTDLALARIGLQNAIESQALAREANRDVVNTCKES